MNVMMEITFVMQKSNYHYYYSKQQTETIVYKTSAGKYVAFIIHVVAEVFTWNGWLL